MSASDTGGNDRRVGDRRREQRPFEGEDRRKGERRSVHDRRANPRSPTES